MSILNDNIIRECESVINADIRPKLRAHNGDICLDSYRDGTVHVRLLGQCSHCPSSKYTVESLVKKELTEKVASVQQVFVTEYVSDDLLVFARTLLQRGI